MKIVNVGIMWTDDVEAAYQKFKSENSSGVFPPTEENFIQALVANAVAN